MMASICKFQRLVDDIELATAREVYKAFRGGAWEGKGNGLRGLVTMVKDYRGTAIEISICPRSLSSTVGWAQTTRMSHV